MQIMKYTKAQSLEEAWQANQKRSAVILGGCCWLRLSPQRVIGEAIDLSGLSLQGITEDAAGFHIGAMTTLRQVETSPALAAYTQGAMKESVRHIVGTQFRNLATVGGSICGRFGFSDVWTLFLALQARVVLYKGGEMSLADFSAAGAGNDILTDVVIPKTALATAYASLRLNATDFPIIACAMSRHTDSLVCAVGAKPSRAQAVRIPWDRAVALREDELIDACVGAWKYETNMRGSAMYRQDMARVLCRRLWHTVKGESGNGHHVLA